MSSPAKNGRLSHGPASRPINRALLSVSPPSNDTRPVSPECDRRIQTSSRLPRGASKCKVSASARGNPSERQRQVGPWTAHQAADEERMPRSRAPPVPAELRRLRKG